MTDLIVKEVTVSNDFYWATLRYTAAGPTRFLPYVQGSNWTGTHRNGVPDLFLKTGTAFRFICFENSERKSDSCCCVHTSVLPSVAVLKLRLGIEIAINDTSAFRKI